MARGLKFWISEVEGLYYLCRENNGADDLHLFYAKRRVSHDATHMIQRFVTFIIEVVSKSFDFKCTC